MNKMKTIILSLTLMFFICSCMQDNDIPERVSLPILFPQYEIKEPNYDSMCIIGKQYTLYPFFYNRKNKCGEQPYKVIIVAKRVDGFGDMKVQYCYAKDYKKKQKQFFNTTSSNFISQTVNPSK